MLRIRLGKSAGLWRAGLVSLRVEVSRLGIPEVPPELGPAAVPRWVSILRVERPTKTTQAGWKFKPGIKEASYDLTLVKCRLVGGPKLGSTTQRL